ncbi:MAG: RNA methyltransferase [Bacteroidetes bacterium]|nr:RNA methyltransferase [Bacteroidota bacterium]
MLNKTHTKYIQSLHHKKFRDENGVFIAETPKVVFELMASGAFVCREVFATEEWINEHTALLRKQHDVVVTGVKDFELEKLSLLTTPNQVLALFEKKTAPVQITVANTITLVLDTIQDPGNLGTIIRTADWFGIQQIVCSPHCADMYNPKVVQSTMGSLARVNILYTSLEEWLHQNNNVKRYAAALDGTGIKKMGTLKEGIVIIGNEGKGISDAVMRMADEKITIERIGHAESLNAAVATGIILAGVVGDC